MSLLRRNPLLSFFVIAFGISWLWVLVLMLVNGLTLDPNTKLIFFAGPLIAGFVMTFVMEGMAGVSHLLRRFLLWRVDVVWYLFALFLPALLMNLGLALQPGVFVTIAPPSNETLVGIPLTFLIGLVIAGPLLQEPGWRGFAFPRMQERWGPLGATLLLGVVWAVWHLPLFFLPDFAGQYGGLTALSVIIFGATLIAMTFLFSVVFNHSGGSLLLAILLHTAINVADGLGMFHGDGRSAALIGYGVGAVAIVLLTRGRLGYDIYLRDEAIGMT